MSSKEEISPIERAQQMAEEISYGRLPTTEQTSAMMEKLEESIIPEAQKTDLSDTGRHVIEQAEKVVDVSRRVLEEVSPENELQKMMYQLRLGSEIMKEPLKGMAMDLQERLEKDVSKMPENLKKVLNDLLELTFTFVKSAHFRRFIGRLNELFKEFIETFERAAKETEIPTESGESIGQKISKAGDIATETLQKESEHIDTLEQAKKKIKTLGKEMKEGLYKSVGESRRILGEIPSKIETSRPKTLPRSRNELLASLKQIILDLMEYPEYHRAINDMFLAFDNLYSILWDVMEDLAESTEKMTEETRNTNQILIRAQWNARKVLEKLAGGFSLDELFNSVSDLMHAMKGDKNRKLRSFMCSLSHYFKNILANKPYVESDSFFADGKDLFDEFEEIPTDNVEMLRDISTNLSEYFNCIATDRLLREFGHEWTHLMSDIFLDSRGRPTLKPELLVDTWKLVKLASQTIKIIPVKHLESQSEDIDYMIHDIRISTEDITPKMFEFIYSTYYNADRSPNPQSILRCTVGKMSASARNVLFSYNKKSVPHISDTGTADLYVQSLHIYFELIPSLEGDALFRVGNVVTNIDSLDLDIHDSRHQTLYSILWPWVKQRVRIAMENGINEFLSQKIELMNDQLMKLSQAYRETYQPNEIFRDLPKKTVPIWGSHVFDVHA